MGAFGNKNAAGHHKHGGGHTHGRSHPHVSTPHVRVPTIAPAIPHVQKMPQQSPHMHVHTMHPHNVVHTKNPSHVVAHNQHISKQRTAHYAGHQHHVKQANSSKIGKGLPGVH